MINKKNNLTAVNILHKDNVCSDAVYDLFLHSKLQKSKEDIKNGSVMTIDESKERMRKKYASFDVK